MGCAPLWRQFNPFKALDNANMSALGTPKLPQVPGAADDQHSGVVRMIQIKSGRGCAVQIIPL